MVRGLELKRVDYELVEARSPLDLRRWNPQTGKMPVVEIDGEREYDSTFILRRLDALVPEPALLSADPAVAACQRQLEDWADESLYWYTMAFRWSPGNAPATTRQILAGAPAVLRPVLGPLLRRSIGGATRAQGLARLPAERLLVEYERRLDDLALLLGERPFFWSERPGLADLAVYSQLRTALSDVTPETRDLVLARPPLTAFLTRLERAIAA